MQQEHTWWKEAVVYQIYPRSFQDSNGDGVGDLNGVRQRLPYLKELGIDVIWLTPIYATPNVDMGYDISDYQAINPEFGTLADVEQLIAEAHALDIKILLDLVVNHTSDQHEWFQRSRTGTDQRYRDFYIWSGDDPTQLPNDWRSFFSGPAWQFDNERDEFYLHLFARQQPDLNWRNPEVRDEVFQMMRWWLDKGIDGFRMDVISLISKPESLHAPQDAVNSGPHVHEYLREMNEKALADYDIMTVGETPGVSYEDALSYAGFDAGELNMVFQFEHVSLFEDAAYGKWKQGPFDLVKLKRSLSNWQVELNGRAWNSLYWNNHDQPRVVSRFGNDSPEYRVRSAKMLGAVLHYLQGTPYIYQGEELGMTNRWETQSLADYRDIETINAYRELVEEQGRMTAEQMMRSIRFISRDNARTPMQWSDEANAGFTAAGVEPWIGINANYLEVNAASQVNDPDSVFAFYRQMNQLRKQHDVIVYGDYQLLNPEDPETWIYERRLGKKRLLVAANFTDRTVERQLAAGTRMDAVTGTNGAGTVELLQSNYPDDAGTTLRPYEVKVYLEDAAAAASRPTVG